jgi:hypothetical protein
MWSKFAPSWSLQWKQNQIYLATCFQRASFLE